MPLKLPKHVRKAIAIPGRAKYNNRKTVVDGITFDSKGEAERYQILKMCQVHGQIECLMTKCKECSFDLRVNGSLICKYIADFVYFDKTTKRTVVEDYKGVRTAVYKLKKKLMKAIHGIDIFETGKRK